MTTLKDYIRDDVVEFLKDWDSDDVASKGTDVFNQNAEALVEDIMETITEKLSGFLSK